MELRLVNAEDVRQDEQCKCANGDAGTVVTEELRDTFDGLYELTVAALETEGYKSFTCPHPKLGRDVEYFVKDGRVIAVDYHGANVATGVLPETEAKSIIEDIKDAFGDGELEEK